MVIGGLISNRNFGSFIGSGNGCQGKWDILHQRRQFPCHSALRCDHANTRFPNLCTPRINGLIPRCACGPFVHANGSSDGNLSNPARTPDKGDLPCFMLAQFDKRHTSITLKQRVRRNCKCCLSLSFRSSWNQPRLLNKFDVSNEQLENSGSGKINRMRAYYKSEEDDITDSKVESVSSTEGSSEAVVVEGNVQETSFWWKKIPKRWVIVLLCFASFLLCNMDRVNMSIAILPMSQEFNWNSATVGLIQSSFFWGYLLTQILGGIWADKVGGKLVLGFGVVWWSLATVLTPIAARIGLPFLLIMRAFMGIGEGVAMPAMNNLLSKWIPVSERSRSLALVYSGMYLGSVTGLAFSPVLIQKFGWPSVFYSFGSLGSIWFVLWLKKAYSSPKEDPEINTDEKQYILGGSVSKEPVTVIPWRLILSKAPVWALIMSHFCHNWGTFILLTWMPTYYNQVLKFNLTESGLLCVLPWLTMAIFANIGGWIADTLVSKGLSITAVRKARNDTRYSLSTFL